MADKWCILDDFFPNVLSAFRIAEYNAYLAASPELTIFSSHPRLAQFKATYAQFYPEFAERVQPAEGKSVQGHRFAYLVFLNNANTFLAGLHNLGIPYAFTLYPGGGFGLNEPESDAKLLRVTGSDLLQGVLTTQNVTEAYLAEKAPHVPRDFVFGAVIHPAYFTARHQAEVARRPRYGRDKEEFDVCFVAEKYMPGGANKGWPIFAAAMAELLARNPRIRLHIIGGFGEGDYVGPPLPRSRVAFHGRAVTEALRERLLAMDAVVSPNEPFKLHSGNFDGFPTASCVEASLSGAAMIVSDVLGMNPAYSDGQDIALVEPNARSLVDQILALAENPNHLAALGEAGRRTTHALFHPDLQVGRRKRFIGAAAARAGVHIRLEG
ncbi:glycosyltransferase family 4 protein [Phenylobacterium sp. LjRoot219]|uniref:glycosyltransferase family 4 protein n=1 Tax=Phenylobacterium sp. LjRoot219 TaxID=3342283 RepID=UPI003ECD2003